MPIDGETRVGDHNDAFMAEMESLESAYLQSNDPLIGSGFHRGRTGWVAVRSPLVDAIGGGGTFISTPRCGRTSSKLPGYGPDGCSTRWTYTSPVATKLARIRSRASKSRS
jgi:hypothetical protein